MMSQVFLVIYPQYVLNEGFQFFLCDLLENNNSCLTVVHIG